MYGLNVGEAIRRRDLHARFGGQQQGGIATPSDRPVILAFTGGSGAQHGYEDGWDKGVFCYFGEGQVGPMEFVRGNRALRDHVREGKDLLLFKMEAKSFVSFMGAFVVASWEYLSDPARNQGAFVAIASELTRRWSRTMSRRSARCSARPTPRLAPCRLRRSAPGAPFKTSST